MEKMRPCRPGDVLWSSVANSGAKAEVRVGDPPSHPSYGTTTNHDVCVVCRVLIPSASDGGSSIARPFIGPDISALGEALNSNWGSHCGDRDGWRIRVKYYSGLAIAPLLEQAQRDGTLALDAIAQVVDRHKASVEAQRTAREAAYAAFPVRATAT